MRKTKLEQFPQRPEGVRLVSEFICAEYPTTSPRDLTHQYQGPDSP